MSEKRKKILYVITKSNWGGAQRYVFDLATSLSEESFDITVAFGDRGDNSGVPGLLAEKLHARNIRTLCIPSLSRDVSFVREIRTASALRRLLQREHPDILHLNSSKVGAIGALIGRFVGVPRIIYTAHGWAFWEDRNPFIRLFLYVISLFTIFLSHATIVISEYDRRAVSMPFLARKLHVVQNGIAEITFVARETVRNRLYSKEDIVHHCDDLWLLTAAELHPNKNISAAIEAVGKANERSAQKIFYTIMGSGNERTALDALIQRKGLAEHVRLHRFIEDALGGAYLKGFDAFFLPSKKEGVPYVIIEAGNAGLPVVATPVGGIPEIIKDGKNGILSHGIDVESLAEALMTLIHNSNLRQSLGKHAQERARIAYGLAHMTSRTVALYTTVLS